MTIGVGWAEGAFETGSFASGSWVSETEIRVVCLNKSDGSLLTSTTGEYSVWPAASVASLGAPAAQGTGTTNGSGELVVNISGAGGLVFGDEVLVAIRNAQGGASYSDDDYGFGSDTVTYV